MNVILDGLSIESEDDFHEAIAKAFNLPNWYGRNLDALWDVLTGMIDRPINLVWLNSEVSRTRLKRYEKIVGLLKEIADRDIELGRSSKFEYKLQ